MNRQDVRDGTKRWVKWWIGQRLAKLEGQLSETMAVNPFLMPFLFEFHGMGSFNDLIGMLVAGHLLVGHNTGFGKLIDEKILPDVFGTTRLSSEYRRRQPPFAESCFDEIDHIVRRDDGATELLSLKAGRWTIQLTMAVQLNTAFNRILAEFGGTCDRIVVGVSYGKRETLTDKFDILRGINRGAPHDVTDLTDRVFVYAGKDFWQWLSGGIPETQDWVLEGIMGALEEVQPRGITRGLLDEYVDSVTAKYEQPSGSQLMMSWVELLHEING